MAKPALQVEGLPVAVEDQGVSRAHHRERTRRARRRTPQSAPRHDVHVDGDDEGRECDVPVSIADFHSVDHLGSVFLMGLVPGEAAPPTSCILARR